MVQYSINAGIVTGTSQHSDSMGNDVFYDGDGVLICMMMTLTSGAGTVVSLTIM